MLRQRLQQFVGDDACIVPQFVKEYSPKRLLHKEKIQVQQPLYG